MKILTRKKQDEIIKRICANKSGHMEFNVDEMEMFLNDLVIVDNIHDNKDLIKQEN